MDIGRRVTEFLAYHPQSVLPIIIVVLLLCTCLGFCGNRVDNMVAIEKAMRHAIKREKEQESKKTSQTKMDKKTK